MSSSVLGREAHTTVLATARTLGVPAFATGLSTQLFAQAQGLGYGRKDYSAVSWHCQLMEKLFHLFHKLTMPATVEGAFNRESLAPFGYGGLAMQDALSQLQTSLTKLEKGGARVAPCAGADSNGSSAL